MIEAIVLFGGMCFLWFIVKRPGGYQDAVSETILQQRAAGDQAGAEATFGFNSLILIVVVGGLILGGVSVLGGIAEGESRQVSIPQPDTAGIPMLIPYPDQVGRVRPAPTAIPIVGVGR